MKLNKLQFLLLILVFVTACGGGGGGSSSPAPAPAPPAIPGLVSIAITPANPSLVPGGSQQFVATGTLANNSKQDVTNSVIWSSSATSVAVIRSGGLTTPAGADPSTNSTTVTATLGDISATTNLTVTGGATVDNVMPITVNGALCSPDLFYPNKPCVRVTVCAPGTANCQTIDDILLDTGSFGLRIFKDALTTFTLPQVSVASGPLAECIQFGDGSSLWGAVQMASVILGNEPAVQVPIQVIDATFGFSDPALLPLDFGCFNAHGNPASARYTGILGVGVLTHDCGETCETNAEVGIYYSCNGTTCSGATVPLASQVLNPATALPRDNNGVIVQLPAVPPGGTASLTGNLLFGIGTRPNNTPSQVTAFGTDANARFNTLFNGRNYSGFIDSGSNGLFFNPPAASAQLFPNCEGTTWFCPAATSSFSAINTGVAPLSARGAASFQIGNFFSLNSSGNSVFTEIGGSFRGGFDWGLPFFFGRYVFVGFEGTSSGLGRGPYWAY